MNPADIFAQDSKTNELHPAQEEKPDGQGGEAGQPVVNQQALEEQINAVKKRKSGGAESDQGGKTQGHSQRGGLGARGAATSPPHSRSYS